MNAKPVKICADSTIVFPLIVAATFARDFHKEKELKEQTGNQNE